ncbi:hypothetical protein BJ875DRAFT_449836 [Amylocarpus encephaloides]|uniref:Uncharacterized protein n=1 Tax=Amylocarpus encephaloides TaxID=45428 RepID=A0A9P7YT24_9HELO|nr:hypothetical protein BJ875DRAFT_449836 [Amylocarpus encephaloides]
MAENICLHQAHSSLVSFTAPNYTQIPTVVKPEVISISPKSTPSTLSQEAREIPPRLPSCFMCKGNKYSFASYFHNTKIFASPPHELLAHVEQSYILRDWLQTLLNTYVRRTPDTDIATGSERYIRAWGDRVQCLVKAIPGLASSPGFTMCKGTGVEVEALISWTKEMVEGLVETAWGRYTVHLSKERMKELLWEFRKLWEQIWLQYVKKKDIEMPSRKHE